MTITVTQCPECSARVALCDNNVRLDYPAVRRTQNSDADWWIMEVGPLSLAAAGGPDHETHDLAHTLHEHQPPEKDDET